MAFSKAENSNKYAYSIKVDFFNIMLTAGLANLHTTKCQVFNT